MVANARIQFSDEMDRVVRPPAVSTIDALADRAFRQVKDYANDEPFSLALWAFGIGFVLGWRLKPW